MKVYEKNLPFKIYFQVLFSCQWTIIYITMQGNSTAFFSAGRTQHMYGTDMLECITTYYRPRNRAEKQQCEGRMTIHNCNSNINSAGGHVDIYT